MVIENLLIDDFNRNAFGMNEDAQIELGVYKKRTWLNNLKEFPLDLFFFSSKEIINFHPC